MAKRKLIAQLNLVNCKVVDSLELVTKPNLAMTPKQVQELTNRGIAVSLPNEKSFLDGSPSSATDWSIDPMFPSHDIGCMWELSRDCQGRILKAQKADKKAHAVKD